MIRDKDLKDKLDYTDEILISFKIELKTLKQKLIEKRKRFIRKKIRKKLIARKKKEAFPLKSSKYNELFQDLGKEGAVKENQSTKK